VQERNVKDLNVCFLLTNKQTNQNSIHFLGFVFNGFIGTLSTAMYFKPFHTAGIIMLALIGGALLLFVLIVVTTALTLQAKTASIFLPAKETTLLVNKPTEKFVKNLSALFPVLKDLSIPPDTENLALVNIPNGSTELAFFMRREIEAPLGWQKMELPPFVVITSSQTLAELIQSEKDSLNSVSEYSVFSNLKKRKETWGFLRLPERYSDTFLDTALEVLALDSAKYASYKETTNGFILKTISTNKKPKGTIPASITQYINDPILSINTQNLTKLWTGILDSLEKDEADKKEGIVSQIILNTFGQDISLKHEILPLIENTSYIEISRNGSGAFIYTISGRTKKRRDIAFILSSLHKSLEKTMDYGIETRTRILDDRFTSKDIRMNGNNGKNEISSVEMWQVQQTFSSENIPIFTTAIHGMKFFLSNSPNAKIMLETGGEKVSLPTQNSINRGKAFAGGVVNVPETISLLKKSFMYYVI